MEQDGAQHTGLAEFGNESVSTEREGVAKMTSQLRKGLDWGRLWVKGAPRRQRGVPRQSTCRLQEIIKLLP